MPPTPTADLTTPRYARYLSTFMEQSPDRFALTAASVRASHGRGIDHRNAWSKPCEASEVPDVERQQVRHRVDVADGYEAGVMHLLADHPQGGDEGFPRRVDIRGLREERKLPFKHGRSRLCIRGRQS